MDLKVYQIDKTTQTQKVLITLPNIEEKDLPFFKNEMLLSFEGRINSTTDIKVVAELD